MGVASGLVDEVEDVFVGVVVVRGVDTICRSIILKNPSSTSILLLHLILKTYSVTLLIRI